MSLIAKPGAGNFTPAPVGMHCSICVWCIDLGEQEDDYQGKKSINPKIVLGWELGNISDEEGKPIVFTQEYSNYLSGGANLTKMYLGWFGRAPTPEAIEAGYDNSKVIGCACNLNIIHTVSKAGRTYADLASISPLIEGQAKFETRAPTIIYDVDDHDADTFDQIPEWIQKKIMVSTEWQKRNNGEFGTTIVQTTTNIAGVDVAVPVQAAAGTAPAPIEESEIPF